MVDEQGIPVRQGGAAESVWDELKRIDASRTFCRCERLRRLLRFIVVQGVNGAGHMKEYTIGTELFGRPDSYDPRADPIVRVETWRLRSKLEEYYSKEGQGDEIEIRVPPRNYLPEFRPRLRSPAAAGQTQSISYGIQTLAILPFRCLANEGRIGTFTRGLAEELTHDLLKLPGISVLALHRAFPRVGKAAMLSALAIHKGVTATLQGAVRKHGRNLRISMQLIRVSDAAVLWSVILERRAENLIAVQREAADRVVECLLNGA
jgi:TolB-like protein